VGRQQFFRNHYNIINALQRRGRLRALYIPTILYSVYHNKITSDAVVQKKSTQFWRKFCNADIDFYSIFRGCYIEDSSHHKTENSSYCWPIKKKYNIEKQKSCDHFLLILFVSVTFRGWFWWLYNIIKSFNHYRMMSNIRGPYTDVLKNLSISAHTHIFREDLNNFES